MFTSTDLVHAMGEESSPKGSGNKLTRATIIVAGVAALIACLVSLVSIWLQLKSMSCVNACIHPLNVL